MVTRPAILLFVKHLAVNMLTVNKDRWEIWGFHSGESSSCLLGPDAL